MGGFSFIDSNKVSDTKLLKYISENQYKKRTIQEDSKYLIYQIEWSYRQKYITKQQYRYYLHLLEVNNRGISKKSSIISKKINGNYVQFGYKSEKEYQQLKTILDLLFDK